jgi:large subunit ribosomal protein L25
MPMAMQVDVSALQMGEHILLGSLTPPAGCTIVGDPEQVVVTVLQPRVIQEPEATPEASATEAPAE